MNLKSYLNKSKKSSGITLIALVVTIVVLLILAGITITMLFSDSGIINKAREAAEATKNSIANDQSDMTNLANQIENFVGGSTSQKDNEQSDSKIKTANQLEAGESILLPYNSGTIECAVLYDNKYNSDNNKEYGIQIISKDTLEDNYTYTKDKPWNDYVHILNEELKKYINDTNSMYVSSVRCVGSLPDNPENKKFVEIPLSDEDKDNFILTPYYDDLNSEPDTEQMKKYKLYDIGKTYFLASKIYGDETSRVAGYCIKASDGTSWRHDWNGDPDEDAADIGPYGLRAVFTLKTEGLTFTFNDEKKAYEISVQ